MKFKIVIPIFTFPFISKPLIFLFEYISYFSGLQKCIRSQIRLPQPPIHLQLLLVHPHLDHNRRSPRTRARHRIPLRGDRLSGRRPHLRHDRRQHRQHDHQHERSQGGLPESDGQRQAVPGISQSRRRPGESSDQVVRLSVDEQAIAGREYGDIHFAGQVEG